MIVKLFVICLEKLKIYDIGMRKMNHWTTENTKRETQFINNVKSEEIPLFFTKDIKDKNIIELRKCVEKMCNRYDCIYWDSNQH